MSTVFLFGAGASAFSGPCIPKNPPLGSALFAELMRDGGIAATVSPALANQFKDFEKGMAEFASQRPTDTTEFQRDMARYFARFEPLLGNFYTQLISHLIKVRESVVLATTNYELLIEIAIDQAGFLTSYAVPPSPDNFSVLKLHGSCNFLPDVPPDQFRGVKFSLGPAAKAILDAGIRPANTREVIDFCDTQDSLAPALALYMKDKQVLFAPKFVEEQQRAWRESVKKADRIFVIGCRCNPSDSHIWFPLQKSKSHLWYVGPDPKPFDDWVRKVKRRHAHHLEKTFEMALPLIYKQIEKVTG